MSSSHPAAWSETALGVEGRVLDVVRAPAPVLSTPSGDADPTAAPYRQYANLQDGSPTATNQLVSMGLNNNQFGIITTANSGEPAVKPIRPPGSPVAIPVAVSARHVHPSQPTLDALFWPGHVPHQK